MLDPVAGPLDYYARPGVMTDPGAHSDLFETLPTSLSALCEVVQGLLIHPFAAHLYGVKVPGRRKKELDIRPVSEMLAHIRERDDSPLTAARAPGERLVGTCRDFA